MPSLVTNQITSPIPVDPNTICTIVSGSAKVEYTNGSLADIQNNVATWNTSTARPCIFRESLFVRITALADMVYTLDKTNNQKTVDGFNPDTGDVVYITNLTASRATTSADNGLTLENKTASNFTLTITKDTLSQPTMLQQTSTGTLTVTAGSGVTFIGATLATTTAGQILSLLPTSTANTYIVKVSA